MNCPKCGFEQEERVDCIRCGIVFSKYLSFQILSRSPSGPTDSVPTSEPGAAPIDSALTEIRQALRDVQRRVGDVEYERAERARLRKDLKALEERMTAGLERLQEGPPTRPADTGVLPPPKAPDRLAPLARDLAQLKERFAGEISLLGSRLQELQQKIEEILPPHGLPEMVSPDDFVELESELKEIYLRPLRDRMDELEVRLGTSLEERRPASDPKISEAIQLFNTRLAELDSRITAITRQWETAGIAELTPKLERGLFELEDLRSSLHNVSVRYSEIGELKKNHLVVLNNLESVRMTLEAFKRQIADGFPRTLSELGKEVAALRAEYRQIWQELHPSDTKLRSTP